jgi:methylated-DNA-[protein]-cysteine S-methyltransferase
MTDLIFTVPTDPTVLARLSRGLAERAADAGLLDIAYRTVDSPVGRLLVAATGTGVVTVGFEAEGHDHVLQRLADRLSPRILHAPSRLELVTRQLEAYFDGRLTHFDIPLDLVLSTGFRREVLERLRLVEFGHNVSYAELAALSGRPNASRAVGTACATNPIPIIVPCHRVLRSDGSLGGYAGGLAVKRFLLDLERQPSRMA